MKKLALIVAPLALVLSSQALAWKGNGQRPTTEPKIPADIDKSQKTDTSDGNAIVIGSFSNRKGTRDLVCDVFGRVTARRGGDETDVTAFVDKRLVKAYRDFNDRFLFELSEFGPGYKMDKKSQKYEAACLSLDPGETPDQVPAPHDKCDPEWMDCDWTCKADQNAPDQCGNPSQDW